MDDLKSQNILSCPGSLIHGLGVWADHKLQEVTQKTIFNFRISLELKNNPTAAYPTKCPLFHH